MHRKSFTLLEVLFVLCVASLSLFFIVNAFSRMISAFSTVRQYTKAMFLTEQAFFNISQKDLNSYRGKKYSVGDGFYLKEDVKKIDNDIFSVAIYILWKEGKLEKKLSTFSYVKRKK